MLYIWDKGKGLVQQYGCIDGYQNTVDVIYGWSFIHQGSNWMVSRDPDSGQGEIVSQNLEGADPVAVSGCASDAAAAGPFLVYHDRFGWKEDRDLGRQAFETCVLLVIISASFIT